MGGFVFGIFTCVDCYGFFDNTIGRVLTAVIIAIISIFSFGFPPKNEAGVGEPFNAWPAILVCWWALIFIKYFKFLLNKTR